MRISSKKKEKGDMRKGSKIRSMKTITLYVLLIVYGARLHKKLDQVVPPVLQVTDSPL